MNSNSFNKWKLEVKYLIVKNILNLGSFAFEVGWRAMIS
jgi:hypothetical protein